MGDQHFLSIIVTFLLLCSFKSAHSQCFKFDFNKTISNEIRECSQSQRPALTIKDYSINNLTKYRPTSHYYLGTNFNEFSCIESSAKISLNSESYIEAPVYFKSDPDSYIEITVYDMDRNMPVYSWKKSDGKGAWSMAHIDIKNKIPNAQIMIQTFTNAQSIVAVEFIHILNKADSDSDCINMPTANMKPSLKQGNVQPTKQPGQQGSQQFPQQGPPQFPQGQQGAPGYPTRPPGQQLPQHGHQHVPLGAPGQIPPTKPPGYPNANNDANNIFLHESLVAILVLSIVSVVSIILIGLYYCFVGSRQKDTHQCTK